MPQFIQQATNTRDVSDIVAGFLEAAEFADLPDEDAGKHIAGWTREAKAKATKAVQAFLQAADAADIEAYHENYPGNEQWSDDQVLGHDIWYSTQGHGVGFFDRGDHPCFDRLQDVARKVGREYCIYRTRNGWLHLEGGF